MIEEQVTEVKPKEKPKKKKPELKKAKETKEKVKTERVKIDKKEVRKEKLVPKEQPEEKSVELVVKYVLIINVLYMKRYNYNGNFTFRKIVDVEETQVLETTEIIEEQPTEVNTTIKYIYNYVRWCKKFLNNLRLMELYLNFNNLASTILIQIKKI